jgi:hypothetical protein
VPDKQQTFEVGGKPHMAQRLQMYSFGCVQPAVWFVEVGAVKRAKIRCHAHPILLDYLIHHGACRASSYLTGTVFLIVA